MSCWHACGMFSHDLREPFEPSPEARGDIAPLMGVYSAVGKAPVRGHLKTKVRGFRSAWSRPSLFRQGKERRTRRFELHLIRMVQKRSLNKSGRGGKKKKADLSTFLHQRPGLDGPLSRLSRLISASHPLQPGAAGGPCR